MASPGGSTTGSLPQGVRRLSWLFSDQVNPVLVSDAMNPKVGWATTLTHGEGGTTPVFAWSRTTYSRPPSAKPPRPLNDSRSAPGGSGVTDSGGPDSGLLRTSSGSGS